MSDGVNIYGEWRSPGLLKGEEKGEWCGLYQTSSMNEPKIGFQGGKYYYDEVEVSSPSATQPSVAKTYVGEPAREENISFSHSDHVTAKVYDYYHSTYKASPFRGIDMISSPITITWSDSRGNTTTTVPGDAVKIFFKEIEIENSNPQYKYFDLDRPVATISSIDVQVNCQCQMLTDISMQGEVRFGAGGGSGNNYDETQGMYYRCYTRDGVEYKNYDTASNNYLHGTRWQLPQEEVSVNTGFINSITNHYPNGYESSAYYDANGIRHVGIPPGGAKHLFLPSLSVQPVVTSVTPQWSDVTFNKIYYQPEAEGQYSLFAMSDSQVLVWAEPMPYFGDFSLYYHIYTSSLQERINKGYADIQFGNVGITPLQYAQEKYGETASVEIDFYDRWGFYGPDTNWTRVDYNDPRYSLGAYYKNIPTSGGSGNFPGTASFYVRKKYATPYIVIPMLKVDYHGEPNNPYATGIKSNVIASPLSPQIQLSGQSSNSNNTRTITIRPRGLTSNYNFWYISDVHAAGYDNLITSFCFVVEPTEEN